MPELNSLRGLACLAVLFFHGLWAYIPQTATGFQGFLRDSTSGGHYGVNLFFVLSGFLITGILLDSKNRADYFKRFYKRRVLRILPAYYIMIALLALYGLSLRFLGLSLLHIANLAPAFGVPLAYGPFWSLAVEEQFYLIWPAIVRRCPTRALVYALILILVINFRLAFASVTDTWDIGFRLWYSSHGLALGALLAIFLRSDLGSRSNVKWMVVGLAVSGITLRCVLGPNPVWASFGWEMSFAALLLGSLLTGTSRYAACTRPRILLFFGDISYGLYLVHILIFAMYRRLVHVNSNTWSILLQFVICSSVSIGLAVTSRFTVEEWFLSLKEGRGNESKIEFARRDLRLEGSCTR